MKRLESYGLQNVHLEPWGPFGLNGYGFMQDPLEYGSRTHHSNMDLYDRVQIGDVMQGAALEAWFVYNTATRPEMLPRNPVPTPTAK